MSVIGYMIVLLKVRVARTAPSLLAAAGSGSWSVPRHAVLTLSAAQKTIQIFIHTSLNQRVYSATSDYSEKPRVAKFFFLLFPL